ncbi:MAG: twin-arginine translocation signal domain-containing protein, partial [Mesorhizobium sp.]
MTDKNGFFDLSKTGLTRRTALKGLAAGAGLAVAPGFVRYSQAQSSAP